VAGDGGEDSFLTNKIFVFDEGFGVPPVSDRHMIGESGGPSPIDITTFPLFILEA